MFVYCTICNAHSLTLYNTHIHNARNMLLFIIYY